MSNERRQPGARVPFEALVEIGAPEGTSFEAESVDLSASGMHLRTAYLPKVGTALSFRFEPSVGERNGGDAVVCTGEVVWAADGDGGCEFGVRFADLARTDAELIQKIVAVTTETTTSPLKPGAPMRIHIEGMSAPMRAVLRADMTSAALVGVDLKTLRLGALVELEDKERGTRRPARVDGVQCEIDAGSRVPQLVVKLRYAPQEASVAQDRADSISVGTDTDANLPYLPTKKVPMPADVENAAKEVRQTLTPPPPSDELRTESASPRLETGAQQRVSLPVAHEPEGKLDGMKDSMRSVGEKMKDVFTGAAFAASAGAARLGARVGTTVALLTKKKTDGDDVEGRRATSAFSALGSRPRTLRPQGASRDFINSSDPQEETAMQEIDSKKVMRRRQVGIAAGIGIAAILGFLAFRKPAHVTPVVSAPAPELAPAPAPVPVAAPPPPPVDTAALASTAPALVGESTGLDAKGNPNPFGTAGVKKGTKMILRLDGPVTEIKGMQMPNGFVVSVPNRKSLEAAGPLAAKDPRIGSAKVVNQPGGAELTIAFKDSATAPYIVKAHGDSIEIILGHEKAIAKKKNKGGAHPAKAPAAPAKKK